MTNETNNSLVNLGDLAQPVDTLIKKISQAVGGLMAPYQIKRIAKAEAEAQLIKAQSEIQITDLQRRAMHRFVEEEAKKQDNIERITNQSIPHISPESTPENMEDDWVTNFFDKSRIVSDQEMQSVWARVLAGEANKPGSFSKRTVNFLGDLDKSDANLFTKLCGFGWIVGNVVPLIFDLEAEIYEKNGINFNAITHLDSIGLITFGGITTYRRLGLPKRFNVFYYGKPLTLTMPNESGNDLNIGHVTLTQIGHELATICGSQAVEGFPEYVKKTWAAFLPNVS